MTGRGGPSWLEGFPPTSHKDQGVGGKDIQKQRHRESDHPSCRGPTLSLHASRNRELTTQVQARPSQSLAVGLQGVLPSLGHTWPGSHGPGSAAR